jgi:hypothetical protein
VESNILRFLGKTAGLGGIALGVFLLLFQGVLQKQFLPQAGLGSAQAFAVILSLMILTFGVAGIGVIAWLISPAKGSKTPVPARAMGILAGLIALVLGAAIYVGAQARPDAQAISKTEANCGGVAIGRDAIGSTITAGAPNGSDCTPKPK